MALLFTNKANKPIKEKNIRMCEEYSNNYYDDMISLEEYYIGIIRESYAFERVSTDDGFTELVFEGFRDMVDEIKRWISKFIEFIKKTFKAIMIVFESIFMDTVKFFNKYKSKVNFDGEIDIVGFEYDFNLMSKVPNIQSLKNVVTSFNNFNEMQKYKKEDYKAMIDKYLEDSNLNDLRKEITTISGLTNDNMREEIRKSFRSGDDAPKSLKIDKSKSLQIINGFSDLKVAADKAKKDERELENTMSSLQSYFEKGANRYKANGSEFSTARNVELDGSKYKYGETEELSYSESVVNQYFRYHYIMMKEVSNIISTTIHEKVVALKEAVKLHTSIGKKAIMKSGVTNIKEEGDK